MPPAPRPEPAFRFTIPRPPSTNALYANVPGKGRVKTKLYRVWIKTAGWTVKAQKQPVPHFDGEVEIEIAGLGSLDVDNTKAIPDLLKRLGILDDDKQIARQVTEQIAPSWARSTGWYSSRRVEGT